MTMDGGVVVFIGKLEPATGQCCTMRTSFAAELSSPRRVGKGGRDSPEYALEAPVKLAQLFLERNAVCSIDLLIELENLLPQQIPQYFRVITAEFDVHAPPRHIAAPDSNCTHPAAAWVLGSARM
jgi:hypothetical protein